MTRQTKRQVAAAVAVLFLGGSPLRAAVVTGPDGKPVRVNPGETGPGASRPGATPGGTPPVVPPRGLPGLPGVLGGKRARPPGPTTGAAPATGTAATPAGGGTAGVTGANQLIGEKDFNTCKKFPAGKRIVKLNLKPDTELGDLIAWISSITCKQFLLPGTIPANSKKVTIVAPELITPEEAYRLFLVGLDSAGLTVEHTGKFERIVETAKIKTMGGVPVYGEGSDVTSAESYQTRLVHVENVDPNEVAQVLGRLKSEQGDIVVFAAQNALIITDLGSSITRMLKVLREIDQPGAGEKVWVIGLKHTGATDMAQKLAEIFQVQQAVKKGGGGAPPPPGGAKPKIGDLTAEMIISKIIPDERSNQLIVIATERSYQRVKRMVDMLDREISDITDSRIHVYYCENANCDELAQTLGQVTGVTVSVSTSGAGGRSRARTATAAPAPAAAPAGGAAASGIQNLLFEGDVRINFDRPTNSLIVVSSLKDYQAVRRVIERLDSPRKQVFVEAMILEVTLDKQRELGVSFHGAKPFDIPGLDNQSLVVGGLNPAKTLFPAGALTETMLAGVLGPVLQPEEARNLGAGSTATLDIPSFGVLIKALQTNSDVDVLSNPHLLIMNNEDGEISVGSRVPFPVSTFGLGGGAAPGGAAPIPGFAGVSSFFPNVQREKVALELKLTPHVNEHDMVRLEVDEKISELAPGASNLGPSTSERTAKTIVVAKDQQTILIGGLMSDKVINTVTKVPLLGDIPILGFFFRNSTKKVVKTNLIIALTPYVISDMSDLRRVLEKKMKERREFVERFGGQERPNPESNMSYRKKVGMLEEINRVAREINREQGELDQLRLRQSQDESGPVELPVGPSSGAPPPGPASAPAPAPAPPPAAPPPPPPAR
ncbi:MAG TPA: type II secretion system secretin GspD [Polyangia bacterium]|nr:type II secretion system secretin GspD [Polyangia bacterium]